MPPFSRTSCEEDRFPTIAESANSCSALALLTTLLVSAIAPAAYGGFVDVTASAGIDDFERVERPLQTEEFVVRGGHPIIMDWDDNGWLDIYIVRFGLDDLIYFNDSGNFTRVDSPLGIDTANGGNGAAWGDIDNDGDKDFLLSTAEEKRYRLYLNNGDGTFEEAAEERGIALPSTANHAGTSVALGDINRDGYLDAVMGDWAVEVTEATSREHYGLFLNRGPEAPGHFTNITEAAGIDFGPPEIHFFTPTISDLDGDGWPDLSLIVDYGKSALYWNNADGTFTNSTNESGVGIETHGMGAGIGDTDNDGDLDFFVTSIAYSHQNAGSERNTLYLNQNGRSFASVANSAGVAYGGWGWGANLFDYDNDGDLDIAMVNNQDATELGPLQDAGMILWRNNGASKYTDVSDTEGANTVGWGVGIVNFDYDNDGDLDLFAVHQFSGPVLLRNDRSTPRNWLRLSLEGTVSNRDGYGAFITIQPTEGGPIQVREYNPTNAYMAQLEPIVHFGLGSHEAPIHKVTVRWPSSIVQELHDVGPNQLLHVEEDETLLVPTEPPVLTTQPQHKVVARGSSLALPVKFEGLLTPSVSWYRNGTLLADQHGPTLTIDPVRSADAGIYHAVATNDAGSTTSDKVIIGVRTSYPDKSIARQWNEAILDAVRINFPDPPLVARNLYHTSAAMWDAFWPYQPTGWGAAQPLFHKETPDLSPLSDADRSAAQEEAISYAVFRVASHRYADAFNSEAILFALRDLMETLGYDPDFTETEGDSPAAVGNRIGNAIIAAGMLDGSNEANKYADTTGYSPVNDPLVYGTSGVTLNDPNRWQPLLLESSVTKNGIDLGAETQSFLAPGWNWVEPFALVKPTEDTILIDPGPQPLFGTETEAEYIRQSVQVIECSSLLDPADDTVIDASPGAIGNNRFLTQDGSGRAINPFTGEAYAPNPVKRGDYWRVTSEFWSDGPGIEGPPGVWNMLHNMVSDDPSFERKLGGVGPELSDLEWDVHAYITLNGALHDAAIASWTIKSKYDSVRPISMIRYLASLGQSSDPNAASYHPSGLPLKEGLIELITAESAALGQRHAHLADHVGELALYSWRGVPEDPDTQTAGVGWIRAADWGPYHLRTFPTPNFAGYISGHSTFSRAGAEVMTLLTGSPYYPGGLKTFEFQAGSVLQVEYGPSEDMEVQVATYYDSADLTGMARLFCGVHIAADDFVGRHVGARVGVDAFLKSLRLRNGAEALAAITKPDVRFNRPSLADTALATFRYDEDLSARPLPTRIVGSRAEAEAASEPGIYSVYSTDTGAGHSSLRIIAKGALVNDLSASGTLSADHTLSLDFAITQPGPVAALARATGSRNTPVLQDATLTLFHLDDNGVATPVASNALWHDGELASLAEIFTNRQNLEGERLPEDAVALPLLLSQGSYRITLGSTQSVARWAELRLHLAR